MASLTKTELFAKLQDIEWEDFEAKEAKTDLPKSSWETVSAFSNTAGGWLIFGVRKTGTSFEITGVDKPEKIGQDFTTTLRSRKFNRKITPVARKFAMGGKHVLAFHIPLALKKPIYFDIPANTFIRSGSGDQRLSEEEIASLFRDSSFGAKDRELTTLRLKDLDKESLSRYRIYLKNVKPEHQYNELSDEELFGKLGVIEKGRVTFGGLLAFGTADAIGKYFADFKIDYFEIFGTSYTDAPNRYEFRLSDYPNVYEYFFAIYERIIKKIDVPFKLKGAFRDENQPQVKAIREALVNMLIHSDYFSPMKPRIRVFLDRIEFFNPGALPKPYLELKKGDISLPRNPTLARVFRTIDLAENAGYGFDKMFNGWRAHYLKDPVVTTGVDYYRIEFFFGAEPAKVTERVTANIDVKVPERVTVKVTERVTVNQSKILAEIANNQAITAQELSLKIGISVRKTKANLAKLKEMGLLCRIGPDKGGHWEVEKK